jgi:hypothetical protein
MDINDTLMIIHERLRELTGNDIEDIEIEQTLLMIKNDIDSYFSKENIEKNHLRQIFNPKCKQYTIIDVSKGKIIGYTEEPLKNIPIIKDKKN